MQVKREPSEHSPINYNYGGSVSPMYAGTSPGPASPHNTPSPVPCSSFVNLNVFRHNTGGGLLEVKPRPVNPFKPEVLYPGTSKQPGMDAAALPYRNMFPVSFAENELAETGSYVQQDLTALSGKIGSTNMGTGCPAGIISKSENDTNRSQFPVESGNTVLDMDSHQYSLDLNLGHLDSAELTRMAMMTDANLSENLSSNLTLDEKTSKSGMDCDQGNMTDSFTRVANNVIQELVALGDMNQQSQQ